jgi:phage terminase small subunit
MAKRPGELTEDLKSQRYETFAIHYFQTGDREASMIAAGYSPLYAKENAPKVLNNTKVQKRLAELRQAAEDKAIMSVVERKQRLSEAGRADITDFIDSEGVPILTADTANHRAVTEYTVSERYTKLGERIVKTRIKLSDPVSNIAELNKMDGVYDTKTTINNININAVQIEDAAAGGKFREVIDVTESKSED